MTVNSNYSAYSSYSSSGVSSSQKTSKPSFEDMAQQMLSSMDTDGNGTVDSAEFSAVAQALASNSNSSSSSSSSSSTSVTDIFTKLDSNGDGGLSTDEFMAALKNSKPQKAQGEDGGMPPPPSDSSSSTDSTDSQSIDKIFSALDTNQDGSISADELAALFEKKSDSSSTSSQTSTSASAQTSASTTETTTEDAFKNMRNDMLQKILSYYGSNASASNTTSLLSVSA